LRSDGTDAAVPDFSVFYCGISNLGGRFGTGNFNEHFPPFQYLFKVKLHRVYAALNPAFRHFQFFSAIRSGSYK
jgi:hypothetical protein